MKKLIVLLVIVSGLLMSCSEPKKFNINGKETLVEPYGLINPEEKNDSIVYKISKEDIVLSLIFSESLIVPVVSIGFYLYQPVEKK